MFEASNTTARVLKKQQSEIFEANKTAIGCWQQSQIFEANKTAARVLKKQQPKMFESKLNRRIGVFEKATTEDV